MLQTEFSAWPCYSKEEADAVAGVLLSNRVNYWTGDICRSFEIEFANWSGSAHAIALANGTVALEAALRGIGVGSGDEVVVTPRSFIASASAVALCGATPVFVDIDPDSQNISPEAIDAAVTQQTKAVIPVHHAGWPCDMDSIMSLAHLHGLAVIEDCAQAHGARYKGRSVGTFGDVGAWSFCQDKIMTTGGEGGMVTTDDPELWAAMWSLKDHGKSPRALDKKHDGTSFRWIHKSFGFNWRLTEMQAAIGRIQLLRMPEWQRKRSENALTLAAASMRCAALRVPMPSAEYEHAWYKFYVFVNPEALRTAWDRNRIVSEIRACGIPCFTGSCPEIYLEEAFAGTGWRPSSRLMESRKLGQTSLMFLVHPTLTSDEIDRTCASIQDTMSRATR